MISAKEAVKLMGVIVPYEDLYSPAIQDAALECETSCEVLETDTPAAKEQQEALRNLGFDVKVESLAPSTDRWPWENQRVTIRWDK